MVEAAPGRKEISDFKFKLFTRLKVFSEQEKFNLDKPTKLVAAASKYGIVFVGTPKGIQCIRTEDLPPQDERNTNRNISSYKRREFLLGTPPTHIDVSCDNEHLAITLLSQDCAVLHIYSVQSCSSANVKKVSEVRLSNTPGVNVSDLQWNPGVANMIAVAMTDGSAAVIEFKDGSFNINSIPQNSQASCLCWSPKGKQVVIGARNGSLTQYKPELKAVKTFPPPQLGTSGLSVISVHWLSSFQFIAVYKNVADPSSKSNVVVVNVPKNAPTRYVNYEELCFESDTSRPEHYFIHQQVWNVLLIGTTNSMEASVLRMEGDNWVQWLQEEGSRPELPLTDNHEDVYNIGIALDTSSSRPIPVGEKLQIGPMPLLLMYAHNGTLCLFHVINVLPDTPSICQAPQPLQDTSGLHLFTAPQENASSPSPEAKNLSKPTETRQSEGLVTEKPQPNLGQISLGEPAASLPSVSHAPQVSSAFAGFGFPLSQSTQPSEGGLGQPSFAQVPLMRPGLSQPQSFFNQNTAIQPNVTLTPRNNQPLMGQPLLLQGQQQTPKLSSLLGAPAPPPPQIETQIQSQTQSPAQPQIHLLQQPAQEAKPDYTTPSTWHPLNFHSQQPQAPVLNAQMQPAVPKSVSTPSTFSMQPIQEKPVSTSPLASQELVPAVTPVSSVQESSLKEATREIDKAKELELLIERCQELIVKFSREMEDRQKSVKTIMSRTDQNIQKSSIKDKVINDIAALMKFEDRLKDCKPPDQAKVNALGSSLMEMFGWYEKIKARERMTKSSSYIELMESQDLDPVTKNYLNSIDKHIYYLESQIKQAKVKLGALWDNLETTMDIPVMETIYQSLVAQHNILAAKRALIDSYESKLKKINYNRMQKSSQKKVGDLELSTLADRLLDTKLVDGDLLKDTSLKEAANNYIVLANKIGRTNLSEEKIVKLSEWHKNHKVIKTKISKNCAIIQSSFLNHIFNEISPSKQSTPYISVHGTPKKAIVSVPRKSLFTLTSIEDEPTTNNSVLEIPKKDMHPKDIDHQEKPDKSVSVSSNAGIVQENDIKLQQNLISTSVKTTEAKKLDDVPSLPAVPSSIVSTSSSFFNVPSQPIDTKLDEATHPPATFKSVSQETKTKPESVISTSWGAQAPVFSYHSFFSSISKSPTTSASIFSSNGSSLVQSVPSAPSNYPFSGVGTSSALTTSQVTIGSNPVFQTKSTSSSASPPTQSFFSGSPKNSVPISSSNSELNLAQPNITPTYIPTPLKSTSQPLSTPFFASPLTFSSLTISPSSAPPTSIQSNVPLPFNPKSSTSIFPVANPGTTYNTSNTLSPNAVSPSLAAVTSVSFLSITPVVSTSASPSTTSVFGATQQTPASSLIPSPPLTSPSSVTSTSLSPKVAISQPSIQSPSNPQSLSPVQASQSPSSLQNTLPKSTTTSWTSGTLFGSVSTNPSTFPTTSVSIFGSPTPSLAFGPPSGNSQFNVSTSSLTTASSTTSVSSFSFASASTPTVVATVPSSSSAPSSVPVSSSTGTSASISSSTETSIPVTSSNESLPPLSSAAATSVAITTSTIFGSSSLTTSTNAATTTAISTTSTAPPTTTTAAAATTSTFSVVTTSSSPTTTSIFSGNTTASIFSGSFKSPSTTSQSFFGNTSSFVAATTTSSIFGTSTTSSTVFGAGSSTSVFGGTPKTTASIFVASSTAPTTTPLFGATTVASPVFAGAPNFGSVTTASSFGSPNQSNTVFGAASALSSTPFFNTTTAATTGSQAFGTPSGASIFGGASSFGSPASTTSSSASFFGKAICSPASTSSNVFGSSGSVFGQATPSKPVSIFSGESNFQQKPTFGQSGNLFGQTTTSAGTFGASGGSLFGGTSSFSSPSQQANIFQSGNTSGNIFGGSTGGPFSSPQAGQTSFGAPPSFQSPQRPFGSAPVFGSAPSFGSQPTFGGSPSFGGSPNKVFGSQTAAAPAFGSPNQQSSTTFETLAQQDTLSFSNLAQQQTFSTNSFAGSSFSSWR